jgi:hypothetical protein
MRTAGTYTTVGTVSAPALLGGLVDLDVLDDQVGGVETLGVGVGLSVLEETEKNLGGLDGPAGLGNTERLACGSQPLPMQNFVRRKFDAAQFPVYRSSLSSSVSQRPDSDCPSLRSK